MDRSLRVFAFTIAIAGLCLAQTMRRGAAANNTPSKSKHVYTNEDFSSGSRMKTAITPEPASTAGVGSDTGPNGNNSVGLAKPGGSSGDGQPPQPPFSTFRTGFESGNLNDFDFIWDPSFVSINSDPRFVHSGSKSVQFHYQISPQGESHQDHNLFIEKEVPGLTHYFVRGYVYHKYPEQGGSTAIQRKLYYFKDPAGPQGAPPYSWAVILTSDDMVLRINLFSPQHDQSITLDNRLSYNRWQCVEMEVQVNTPGRADGIIRLWLDGNRIYDSGARLNIRDSYTTGTTIVEIGRQADRGNSLPVNEYRYWDDIVIADSYVGLR